MYRILIAKSKKENYGSLYQYLTKTVDGIVTPLEFETISALDAYVENMLSKNYAKSDFIIIKEVDYTIDAKEYSDEAQNSNSNSNNADAQDDTQASDAPAQGE